MSKFEVIRGVEGCCLALDDTRIAGPKPWGGGMVIHAWETDKTYIAVDEQSRWFELFGTPERAARTLLYVLACKDSRPWVSCGSCPILGGCAVRNDGHDALFEWLRGESDEA